MRSDWRRTSPACADSIETQHSMPCSSIKTGRANARSSSLQLITAPDGCLSGRLPLGVMTIWEYLRDTQHACNALIDMAPLQPKAVQGQSSHP